MLRLAIALVFLLQVSNALTLLHLTDVHSWIAGHAHEPAFNSDYGDFYSFVKHLRENAESAGEDIFVFNSGDLVDGTGMSDASKIHGEYLFPIEGQMPYDALTIGNHELYDNETVDAMIDSGFIKSWNGRYLNAQTFLTETGELLGNTHLTLTGKQSGSKLLVFGFIYNMKDNCRKVSVETVEKTIEKYWFQHALSNSADVSAIVVLSHMGYDNELIDEIHKSIRAHRSHRHTPVVFLAGHTHIRAKRRLDEQAYVVESGHYFDTVGKITFAGGETRHHLKFDVNFIDTNTTKLSEIVRGDLHSPEGDLVKKEIAKAVTALNLDKIVGCSPHHFFVDQWVDHSHSLFKLYLESVIPSSLFRRHDFSWMILSTGSLRYDVFEGRVVLNDIYTVCPFKDIFWTLPEPLTSAELQTLEDKLLSPKSASALPDENNLLRVRRNTTFPSYASTGKIAPDSHYEIIFSTFDAATIIPALKKIAPEKNITAVGYRQTELDSTSLWKIFIENFWRCEN